MHSIHRSLAIVIASAVALSVPSAVALSVPGSTRAACDPNRASQSASFFAGTQRTPSTWPRAVRTGIREYSPFTESGSEVSAWNMLNNGGTKWSQTGWWKSNSGRWGFAQWTNNSGNWFTEFRTASTIGSTPTYETIYNVATADWIWKRNNVVLHTADALWQPKTVQVYGETHNRGDQMPGGTSYHVVFLSAQYILSNGTTWLSMGTNAGATDPTIHGAVKVDNARYEIWDKACVN
jgi:hypothetical protein